MKCLTLALLVLPATAIAQQAPETPVQPLALPDPVPQPAPLPDAVKAMIETALASGDESDIRSVVKIAKASNPSHAAEIDALATPWFDKRKAEQEAKAEAERNKVVWSGRGEFGAFRSTGTIDETGVAASLSLKRKGPRWTHLFRAAADYRRSEGATSRESILVAYEPRLQLGPRSFTYGLIQFERAPFLGFEQRYTVSAGLGSKIIDRPAISLAIDTGPSFRHTDFVLTPTESKLGWRGSLDFDWSITPRLTFRQDSSAYVENGMQSFAGLFALDTKLVTRLSARISYDMRYESQRDALDTLSKFTLTYDF